MRACRACRVQYHSDFELSMIWGTLGRQSDSTVFLHSDSRYVEIIMQSHAYIYIIYSAYHVIKIYQCIGPGGLPSSLRPLSSLDEEEHPKTRPPILFL